MPLSATIILKNLRVPTVIGVYDREKTAPQTLKLDLELSLASAGASLSDKLRDTVDYDDLMKAIRSFAAQQTHELLESFTYELAQRLLAGFPLKHVQITAWKDIAVHAPTEIAVKVSMAAGERWRLAMRDTSDMSLDREARNRITDEDRFND
jgi:7,8-dihydroneopterin aldolase/epimerase/oxygenase